MSNAECRSSEFGLRNSSGQELLARLRAEGLSIIIACNGQELFRSSLHGVRPLVELVDRFPEGLAGATVADRVVGGCAARVFGHLKVRSVLGIRGSIGAEDILRESGINWFFEERVAEIPGRDGNGVCPFEQLGTLHPDFAGFLTAVRLRLAEMRAGRG